MVGETPLEEHLQEVFGPAMVKRGRALLGGITELLGKEAQARPNDALLAVLLAAEKYLEIDEAYVSAPTRRKLRKQLELVADNACKMAAVLSKREPHLLAALEMYDPSSELVQSDHRELALNQLSKLCSSAHLALKALSLSGLTSGQRVATRPPKRMLALFCFYVFDRYRRGEASTTEGGDFRTFVNYVYEVSGSEAGADLEKPVKDALRLVKEGKLPRKNNPFEVVFLNSPDRDLNALRRKKAALGTSPSPKR